MLVDQLRKKEVFERFMNELVLNDKYRKFNGKYVRIDDVDDLIKRCNQLDESHELHRLNGLDDDEIHALNPSSEVVEVECYYTIELRSGSHIQLIGIEYLEEYDQEEKVYQAGSFGAIHEINLI